MTYRILLPIEEKNHAKAQVNFLCEHKLPADAQIFLLCVVQPVVPRGYGYAIPYNYFEEMAQEDERWFNELLSETESQLKQHFPDLQIEKRVKLGVPVDEILKEAKERDVQWILIGSHGRKGLDRFFLGSVSQSVVNRADCSVTIVRLVDEVTLPETKESSHPNC